MPAYIGCICKNGGERLIHFITFGQGKNVLFLHGWGGSTDSFLYFAQNLAKTNRVTLIDFYGFGKTPAPERVLTLDDYVESVMQVVRFLKMESFSLVCHSFGGRVGIKIASQYGYMVDKLVLTGCAGLKPRRKIKYYLQKIKHRIEVKRGIPHQAGSADYRVLSPLMKKTFSNIVNEFLEDKCKKISLPTLLIWGEKDKETPLYMGKRMNKLVKNSGLVILEGCGHFAYLERKKIVLDILKSFLNGEEYVLRDHHFANHHRHGKIVRVQCPCSK